MCDFWLRVFGGNWHGQGEQNRKEGQCKGLEDKGRDRLSLMGIDGISLLYLGTESASQVSIVDKVAGFPINW